MTYDSNLDQLEFEIKKLAQKIESNAKEQRVALVQFHESRLLQFEALQQSLNQLNQFFRIQQNATDSSHGSDSNANQNSEKVEVQQQQRQRFNNSATNSEFTSIKFLQTDPKITASTIQQIAKTYPEIQARAESKFKIIYNKSTNQETGHQDPENSEIETGGTPTELLPDLENSSQNSIKSGTDLSLETKFSSTGENFQLAHMEIEDLKSEWATTANPHEVHVPSHNTVSSLGGDRDCSGAEVGAFAGRKENSTAKNADDKEEDMEKATEITVQNRNEDATTSIYLVRVVTVEDEVRTMDGDVEKLCELLKVMHRVALIEIDATTEAAGGWPWSHDDAPAAGWSWIGAHNTRSDSQGLLSCDSAVSKEGTTKIKNLDQNLGALAVKLSENDLREISEAVPIEEVAGTRHYNAKHEKATWKFSNTPPKGSRVSSA